MFARIRTVSLFTALEAVRGRFFWAATFLVASAWLFGVFANQLSIIEGEQVQAALLASVTRLGGAVLVAVYTINGVVREYQDKGTEMLFATPLSRAEYYLGKLTGYMISAAAFVCAAGAMMLTLAPLEQTVLWAATLFCEFAIVIAFSLFCGLSLGQIPSAIGSVLGFYLLARSTAAMSLMAHHPSPAAENVLHDYFAKGFDGLAYALPRLSDFARTDWLVYGNGNLQDLALPAIQTVVYLSLLGSATLFDLYRKNF